VCVLGTVETRQADVSIRLQLFCITSAAVFSLLFLTVSVLPGTSKTCSLRKQATRGRDVTLAPSPRDIRAALAVSCEQGRVRNVSLGFYYKAAFFNMLLHILSEMGWQLSFTCTHVCEKQNK